MLEQWKAQLAEQVKKGLDQYTAVKIPLDTPRENEVIHVAAGSLCVQDSSSRGAKATIRLNRVGAGDLTLEKGVQIDCAFKAIFLTNAGQAGAWLEIVFGREFRIGLSDRHGGQVQPCFIVTNATPNVNTIAEAHVCSAALVRAHPANAGLAWVNFGAAATDGGCYPLEKTDAVAVPAGNTNQINVLFKTGGDKVTVTYKV